MKAERVPPAREEDVQVTMTAQEARSLYMYLNQSTWGNSAARDLLEHLVRLGVK